MPLEQLANERLRALQAQGLLRNLRVVGSGADCWVDIGGRRTLLLCSNNYLGLATHPALIAAAAEAAAVWGVGAGASRLISGSLALHHELEQELADWKRTEAAVLFNSGYHANIGTITALVGEGDAVFSDALNHASIIDGCRLSRARVVVYPHADVAALAEKLARTPARHRLIVTDSIFSMDGDVAPLGEICAVAQRYDAWVMVDEAHATGVLGPTGAGLVEELGLHDQVDVQMGTLGKALGCFGAYVAGKKSLVQLLLNRARSLVYTTALPPPVVGAALKAVRLVRAQPELRNRLRGNATFLHRILQPPPIPVLPQPTHILPILLRDPLRTMEVSARLLEAGVWVQGIRPPTVPEGTSRLRVTVMATHTREDLEFARDAFVKVFGEERK
ncbi:MAG: 8-amino-7-oxononanoate synthase [candidate division KSB1 bacterium]|nr:8-amino-7-oxononanoate synthase [candidate division KSB1 bacterium]